MTGAPIQALTGARLWLAAIGLAGLLHAGAAQAAPSVPPHLALPRRVLLSFRYAAGRVARVRRRAGGHTARAARARRSHARAERIESTAISLCGAA